MRTISQPFIYEPNSFLWNVTGGFKNVAHLDSLQLIPRQKWCFFSHWTVFKYCHDYLHHNDSRWRATPKKWWCVRGHPKAIHGSGIAGEMFQDHFCLRSSLIFDATPLSQTHIFLPKITGWKIEIDPSMVEHMETKPMKLTGWKITGWKIDDSFVLLSPGLWGRKKRSFENLDTQGFGQWHQSLGKVDTCRTSESNSSRGRNQ